MNKFLRIFLAALLSFQLVVPADSLLGDLWNDFKSEVSNTTSEVKSGVGEIGEKVVDAAGNVVGYIADKAGTVVDQYGNVIGKVTDTAGKVVDTLGNVIGTVWNFVVGSGQDMENKGGAGQLMEGKGKEPEADEPKADQPKQDEPKVDEPKKDEPKGDEPKGNEPKGDDKKKDDGPSVFDKLKDLITGIAALFAADKLNDLLNIISKLKKLYDLYDKASDLKDKYDDIKDMIEDLLDEFKDEVEDSDLPDEDKKALMTCAEEMKGAIDKGGDNVDKELDKAVDKTEDKVTKDTVKDTVKDTSDNYNDTRDDHIDNLLDTVNDESKPKEEREEAARELAKELEEEGYDQEVVDEANELADKIAAGLTNVANELLDLAKDIAISKAEEQLEKYIGKEAAQAIEDYAQKIADGEMTLEEALEDGLNKIIDEYLPPGTADAAKEFLTSIAEGEGVNAITDGLEDLVTNAAKDGIASLLEQTDLTDEQKQEVMEAIESAVNGDWEAAWDTAKGGAADFVGNIVSEKFGKEAGDKAKEAIAALLDGDASNFLDNLVNAGTTIATDELEKKIDGLLNSLAQKYPILEQVFDALGLNGGGIMDALTNCWNALKDGDFANAMQDLISKITDTLNNLAQKLMDFAKNFMSNLMNTITDFFNDILNEVFDALSSAVKAALDSFVNAINALKEKLANASSYFLGNEKNSDAILIEMKNQINNILQKNVFKAGESAK
ncbi:MAG: hypothetical protein IKP00_12980 [Victivallales bacterium]|nr:hypothetical protein [Victivallales bacterium]